MWKVIKARAASRNSNNSGFSFPQAKPNPTPTSLITLEVHPIRQSQILWKPGGLLWEEIVIEIKSSTSCICFKRNNGCYSEFVRLQAKHQRRKNQIVVPSYWLLKIQPFPASALSCKGLTPLGHSTLHSWGESFLVSFCRVILVSSWTLSTWGWTGTSSGSNCLTDRIHVLFSALSCCTQLINYFFNKRCP